MLRHILYGVSYMFRISDLRNKDVVNALDGKKLGFIKDVELNLNDGRIMALVLPANKSFISLFAKENDIIINWSQIVKIGMDVIIVELPSFTSVNACGSSEQTRYEDEARWLIKGE